MDESTSSSIAISDFARAFGDDEDEVARLCGEVIRTRDFSYRVCSQETREQIFLDVLTKFDKGEFSVSGARRRSEWARGWREILQQFRQSNQDLKALMPKDIHGDRPMRYDAHYITSKSTSFEHDFSTVFRNWLYRKYFGDFDNIYEFGCGTGHNLALIADMFPDKKFFGMDWVVESQRILAAISDKYRWQIRGLPFDFFKPDYNMEILPNSLVYTSAAMEQLGEAHSKFIDYLLTKRPVLCVNIEPVAEYYNADSLFDYVALKYHRARNYLSGFLTRLEGLAKDKKIEIIATKRLGFGSLYHEVYNYIVWKIL